MEQIQVNCRNCNLIHELKYAKPTDTVVSKSQIGYVNCGDKQFIASIGGNLLEGYTVVYQTNHINALEQLVKLFDDDTNTWTLTSEDKEAIKYLLKQIKGE